MVKLDSDCESPEYSGYTSKHWMEHYVARMKKTTMNLNAFPWTDWNYVIDRFLLSGIKKNALHF